MFTRTHSATTRKSRIRGFTLIELLVAFSVFAIASLMITASFLSVVDTERRVAADAQIFDEFRLMTEGMQREIAFGYQFRGIGCSPPNQRCTGLEFVVRTRDDMPPHLVAYRLDSGNDKIEKAVQRLEGECSTLQAAGASGYSLPDTCFSPATSETVDIDLLSFTIDNYVDTETKPIVTFAVQGTATVGATQQTALEYSTTVTPRDFQDPSQVFTNTNQAPTVAVTEFNDGGWQTVTPTVTVGDDDIELRGDILGAQSAITEVRWTNNSLYSYLNGGVNTSVVSSFSSTGWTSGIIPLTPGVDNEILIEAVDADGNIGRTIVIVNAGGAPIPPPQVTLFQYPTSDQQCVSGVPRMALWLPVPPNTWTSYRVYRCVSLPSQWNGVDKEVPSGNCTAANWAANVDGPGDFYNGYKELLDESYWADHTIVPWPDPIGDPRYTFDPAAAYDTTLGRGMQMCYRAYGYDPRTGLESTTYDELCEEFDKTAADACTGATGSPNLNMTAVPTSQQVVENTSVSKITNTDAKVTVTASNFSPGTATLSATAPGPWTVSFIPTNTPNIGQQVTVRVDIPAGTGFARSQAIGSYTVTVKATASDGSDTATAQIPINYEIQLDTGGQE